MKIPAAKSKGRPRRFALSAWLCGFLALGVTPLLTTPAHGAACPDSDGDGYVVCGGCELPEGKQCGDCNDTVAAINPAAAEFCGDGIDNDCDGSIDFNAGSSCQIGYPAGCTEPSGDSPCCFTASVYECNAQGSGVVCRTPEAPLEQPEPEQAYSASCHDGADNDCDGLADKADPDCYPPASGELCNSLDDNYDGQIDEGYDLGQECTVGTGACGRSGVMVCDQFGGSACSAVPGTGKSENTPGTGACVDGLDNDCDGLADLADPDCRTEELCDGLDNDGDGAVDEDFEELGLACTNGLGSCAAEGEFVCSPDRLGTVCSGVPGRASVEGPSGETCADGLDNDCDGYADQDDQSCGSADLQVSCALPYYKGQKYPGFNSCVGLHRILFFTNADLENNPNVKMTAELLAMAEDGSTLASIPVKNFDLARLASRKDKEDWTVITRGSNHKVFAPRPVLHVSVDDGYKKAEAFCSDIPFVQMLEPKGKVVASSEGDTTRLYAAIPLINPNQAKVLVDGVDLFAGLGISKPATCTFGSPCAGTLFINGRQVTVTDLVVQSLPVSIPGRNTLEARLTGLGCGQHIFQVSGIKRFGAFPNTPDEQCLIDDLADAGTSSGLEIRIDSPEDFSVLAEGTVYVSGTACSGREISDVAINGQLVDIASQTYTEGDGVSSGDLYAVVIDSAHPVTNLAQDTTAGDSRLGTFDVGSNKLTAMVTDDLGNRSFDEKMFAVGDTALPAVQASLQNSLGSELMGRVRVAAEAAVTEIDNAFVVGMSNQAIQDVFNNRCVEAGKEFEANLKAKISSGWVLDSRGIEVSVCSCTPTVTTKVTGVSLDPSAITCPVTFTDGKMEVDVNLPDVRIDVGIDGYCRVGDPVFDVCVSKTVVSGYSHTVLSGARMEFEITEEQLLGTASPASPVFYPPTASEPPTGNISASIHCLATLCDILLTPIASIVNLIAGERLIPVIGFGQSIDVNFEAEVGSSAPDPIQLGDIKVDEQEIQGTGQKAGGKLSSVEITPSGLVAGLKGSFEALSVDPEVEPTLGAVLTPAPLPAMPVTNTDDIFFALADDSFNQFFASMAVSGKLKTGCAETGKTVGDLLPLDCATLSVGECSNDSTISCKQNSDCGAGVCQENALKTAVAKGACYGFLGANCATLPLGQRLVCVATRDKLEAVNINATQPLLFCNRQDIPPRLLISDDWSTTTEVETTVRLNDLSVALIVDRDANGQLDEELSATHRCFAEGAPTVGDCNFFGACLDLNIETAMQLASKQCQADPSVLCTTDADCAAVGGTCGDVCAGGEPGFFTRVKSLQPTIRSLGVVCGGPASTGDDDLLANTSGEDTTINILLDNANRFAPPACIQGLSNDFMSFKNPRLISIEADGDPTFGDYLGITGEVE